MLHGGGIEEGRSDAELHPRSNRAWTPLARALAATGDRWTLTIVLQLAHGSMRVTQLHKRLPGVSTGVLERYVGQLVKLGLLRRTRFKERPPRVELELTDAGRELLPVAGALARWGMRHLWSPPRARERVDLDALLRLLPMLLEEQTDLPDGCLEALVADTQPPVRLLYRVQDGRLRMDDRCDDDAPATSDAAAHAPAAHDAVASARRPASVHGDRDAWIAALGPAGDYGRLRFSGDERLARRILDSLPGPLDQGLPQWAS
jgi:DNA-binding HxlR family transcriptional regulator